MWSAAILAGGQSRRLGGRPKGALPVGGRPILARQLDVLRSLAPAAIVVVGVPGFDTPVDVPIVADAVPGAGALGGLYTALAAAPSDPVLVVAGDLPFVSGPWLMHLVEVLGNADGVVPRTADGRHPLCAVYRRRAAPRLKAWLDRGTRRITDALSDLNVREVGPDEVARFDPDGVLLMNVNTPEEYDRACRHVNARRP
ncbi:MAG: molybdenum cofactor guanylyltransferase [Acidobacteriota bacterium]